MNHQHTKAYKIQVNKACQERDRLSFLSLPPSLCMQAKFSTEPGFTALIMNFSPSSRSVTIFTGEMESRTQACIVRCTAVLPVNCTDSGPSLSWFHAKGFYLPPYCLWQAKKERKRNKGKVISICLLLCYPINEQKLASAAKISFVCELSAHTP